MHCNACLKSMGPMTDGEVGAALRLAIMAHCVVCRSCWQELRALRGLRSLARRLPQRPAPPELATRVRLALAGRNPGAAYNTEAAGSHSVRGGRTRTRLAIAGAAILAAASLLMWPSAGRQGGAAAAVRRALASVNTWHLRGWKTSRGVRVPWEVWCRRTPFFYREQMGSDVVYDDGVRRTCVLGPYTNDAGISRSGIVVRLPSAQDTDNVRWSHHRLVEPWNPHGGWPFVEEPDETVYSMTTQARGVYHRVYHVDRGTALPTRFEVIKGSSPHEYPPHSIGDVWARLDVQFDAPVSSAALEPPAVPTEFAEFDGSAMPEPVAGWHLGTAAGISLEIAPIGCGDDGTFAARVRGRVGRTIVASRREPVRLAVSGDGMTETEGGMRWEPDPARSGRYERPALDDRGRAYVTVDGRLVAAVGPHSEIAILVLTPREPIQSVVASPRSLDVTLRAELVVDTSFGDDLMDETSDAMRIRSQRVALRVPVPAPAQRLAALGEKVAAEWDAGPWPWSRSPWYHDNLTSRVYLARYESYRRYPVEALEDGNLLTRRRAAARWLQRHVDACTSVYVLRRRVELAELYLKLHETGQARQALTEVLEERRFNPNARYTNAGDIGEPVALARHMLEDLDEQQR